MKIRSLLTVVAMLSILLFGIGTAHAVIGVADDVPGQDIAMPIICACYTGQANCTNTTGTDTLWAIADVKGGTNLFLNPAFNNPDPLNPSWNGLQALTTLHVVVHEPIKSAPVKDLDFYLSPFDVLTDTCSHIVSLVDAANRPKLVRNLCDNNAHCLDYFIGYVTYEQGQAPQVEPVIDRYVSWVYLTDLNAGYASGFNGISFEGGIGLSPAAELEEDAKVIGGVPTAVAARHLYPRYLIENNQTETHTWWILLFGRADLTTGLGNSNITGNRILDCFFYDEDEDQGSNQIPIPRELEIIDVLPWLTVNFSGSEKNGFAICDIKETGARQLNGNPISFRLLGTADSAFVTTNFYPTLQFPGPGFYSVFAWSHEKVQGGNNPALSWDVIHTIHRSYCGAAPGAALIPIGDFAGGTPSDNVEPCGCSSPASNTVSNGDAGCN